MKLAGTVTTGLGKGAMYIGMDAYQERFKQTLGFYPFAGTLNLEVDAEKRAQLEKMIDAASIEAPVVDGNRLSDVDIFPVTVQGIDAALLRLEKTDHPDTIAEVIAPVNLRETLDIKDGDTVILQPADADR